MNPLQLLDPVLRTALDSARAGAGFYIPLMVGIAGAAALWVRQTSTQDKMTGLLNRHGWKKSIYGLIGQAKLSGKLVGQGGEVAIIFIDLNGFKAINDTHGHCHGDHAIEHFAGLLTHFTKRRDVVARLGGDEFAIMLRTSDASSAAASLIERIRKNTAKFPVVDRGGNPLRDEKGEPINLYVKFSAGVGVEELSNLKSRNAIDKLVERADGDMYEEKRGLTASRASLPSPPLP